MRFFGIISVLYITLITVSCGYKSSPLPPLAFTAPKVTEKRLIVRPEELILNMKFPQKYIEGRYIKEVTVTITKCNKECDKCITITEMRIDIPKNQTLVYTDYNYEEEICYRIKAKTQDDIEFDPIIFIVPDVRQWPQAPEIENVKIKKNEVTLTVKNIEYSLNLYKKKQHMESYPPEPIATIDERSPVYVDKEVKLGDKICYTARNSIAQGLVEIESAESNEVCANIIDTEPPPKITGLGAIYKDGKVFIVWDKVEADDLAGYIVYKELDGKLVRLNEEVITVPSFIDETPIKGINRYAVTAVDESGNESEKVFTTVKAE